MTLFKENTNSVLLWPRRSPRPGPICSLLASPSLFPSSVLLLITKASHLCLHSAPTSRLRALARVGPPSSLQVRSPPGQTDLRQANTLTDLRTTQRGTKKKESFSRRWPECVGLKWRGGEGARWAAELRVRETSSSKRQRGQHV